jgi:hypothetical protein
LVSENTLTEALEAAVWRIGQTLHSGWKVKLQQRHGVDEVSNEGARKRTKTPTTFLSRRR